MPHDIYDLQNIPDEGIPYMFGDIYVPQFWPPFSTFAESITIFWGQFFISFNRRPIFFDVNFAA